MVVAVVWRFPVRLVVQLAVAKRRFFQFVALFGFCICVQSMISMDRSFGGGRWMLLKRERERERREATEKKKDPRCSVRQSRRRGGGLGWRVSLFIQINSKDQDRTRSNYFHLDIGGQGYGSSRRCQQLRKYVKITKGINGLQKVILLEIHGSNVESGCFQEGKVKTPTTTITKVMFRLVMLMEAALISSSGNSDDCKLGGW